MTALKQKLFLCSLLLASTGCLRLEINGREYPPMPFRKAEKRYEKRLKEWENREVPEKKNVPYGTPEDAIYRIRKEVKKGSYLQQNFTEEDISKGFRGNCFGYNK